VDGGLVVVGADDGTVTAFDLASGKMRWHQDLGDVVDTPIAAGAAVVYASVHSNSRQRPSVVALREAAGAEVWRYTPNTSGLVAGAPSVVNGTMYVTLGDGTVRAVAAAAVVVARTGAAAGLVGLAANPTGSLIDERSPTIVMPASLALDWATAAIPLAVVLILAGRFLIARLGPPEFEREDLPALNG